MTDLRLMLSPVFEREIRLIFLALVWREADLFAGRNVNQTIACDILAAELRRSR
jgi:hypothetical protein